MVTGRPARSGAHKHIWTISVAQLGWVALALLALPVEWFVLVGTVLFAVELVGSVLAQRRTPTVRTPAMAVSGMA